MPLSPREIDGRKTRPYPQANNDKGSGVPPRLAHCPHKFIAMHNPFHKAFTNTAPDNRTVHLLESPLRTCPCGSQTTRPRCIPCERQEAANVMLDRIKELMVEFEAEHNNTLERLESLMDEPSRNLMWATWWQDFKDLVDWGSMAHDLKYAGLTYGARAADIETLKPLMTDWPKQMEHIIAAHRRARVKVVSSRSGKQDGATEK
jgi:hypothetical protein